MNNLVSFLIGVCTGAYFDTEVKKAVPFLDADKKEQPTDEPTV